MDSDLNFDSENETVIVAVDPQSGKVTGYAAFSYVFDVFILESLDACVILSIEADIVAVFASLIVLADHPDAAFKGAVSSRTDAVMGNNQNDFHTE